MVRWRACLLMFVGIGVVFQLPCSAKGCANCQNPKQAISVGRVQDMCPVELDSCVELPSDILSIDQVLYSSSVLSTVLMAHIFMGSPSFLLSLSLSYILCFYPSCPFISPTAPCFVPFLCLLLHSHMQCV